MQEKADNEWDPQAAIIEERGGEGSGSGSSGARNVATGQEKLEREVNREQGTRLQLGTVGVKTWD